MQNSTGLQVRRATTEDIGKLIDLWKIMRYPAEDLAKRVTEFQIVEDASGNLIGAAALEIVSRQGRLHSEGFLDFSLSERTRPLLWERLTSVANNHGLLNIWTQDQAPFWKHQGFVEPAAEVLQKIPAQWKTLPGRWVVLKLREDVEAVLSMDQEFAVFMQAEKAKSQRALQHAKALKILATLIAAGIFILVIVVGWYLIRQNKGLFSP